MRSIQNLKIGRKNYCVFLMMFIIATAQFGYSQNKEPNEMDKVAHYTQVVDNYLKGLNQKNLELILSLYAIDGTVEDPVGSDIVEGMAALKKFYGGAVTYDLKLTRTGAVRIASNEVAFPFELEMEVDGKMMKTEIIDVFKFNDKGKIRSMRAFWGPSNQTEVGK